MFDQVAMVHLLITYKAKLYLADYNGKTPLTLAVEQGLTAITEILITNKAYEHQSKEATQKSLSLCLEKDNYEIAKLLVSTGIDVNYEISYGKPILFEAITKGKANFVALFVSAGANVNYENYSKETPLYLAINQGSLDMVTTLVDAEADVNYCYHEQQYRTSRKGRYVDSGVIKKPILSIAVEKGLDDIATLLINAGASYNFEGSYDLISPFEKAVSLRRVEVLKLMFEIGVDSQLVIKVQGSSSLFGIASSASTEIAFLTSIQLEASKARDKNNEQVLTKFLKYLSGDQENYFSIVPGDIITLIVQYSLGLYNEKLSELTCDNYIKYHPYQLDKALNDNTSVEIIGDI